MHKESNKEEELREVQADEVLDKIHKGVPVEYYHVRIIGDLNISKLSLPTKHVDRTDYQIKILNLSEEAKVVSSLIRINDSKFDAIANFSNTIFKDKINFENTTFGGNVDFSGATFSKGANFIRATFIEIANFIGATFSKETSLGATYRVADFIEATFSEYADFVAAIFSGYADFTRATFRKGVDFRGTHFEFVTSWDIQFKGYGNLWKMLGGDATDSEAIIGIIYNTSYLLHRDMQEIKELLRQIRDK